MSEILKKIGFAILVIVLTAVFYWIIFLDKAEKQQALEHTMNLLGDKLMAMIPDTAEKDSVEMLYQDFLKETQARNVPPETVERVAANIINLSNLDTVITPEQAKAVIKLSMTPPLPPEPGRMPKAPAEPTSGVMTPEQSHELNERIQKIYAFNESFRHTMRPSRTSDRDSHHRPQVKVDQQMRILIDPTVRAHMESSQWKNEEMKKLQQEMKKLEQERIIEWRAYNRQHVEQEKARAKIEIEKAKLQMQHVKLDSMQNIELQKAFETLKCLETLPVVPVIPSPDSIQILIQRELNAAGIQAADSSKSHVHLK